MVLTLFARRKVKAIHSEASLKLLITQRARSAGLRSRDLDPSCPAKLTAAVPVQNSTFFIETAAVKIDGLIITNTP
jgi:hypothetical protein